MDPFLSLMTTCGQKHIHLIQPFVAHYRAYGVRNFLINLHLAADCPIEDRERYASLASTKLRQVGLELHAILLCPFDALAIRQFHDTLQMNRPETKWYISADIDEFHEYPGGVLEAIGFMERGSLDYMRGVFVDRIARDGFPHFDESQSVWAQFPLGCNLTHILLRGWIDKVMIHRAGVRLLPGHHFPHPQGSLKVFPGVHPVHHFKWDASVVPRLTERLDEDWQKRCPWWVESKRALDWIAGGAPRVLPALQTFDFMDDWPGPSGPISANARYGQAKSTGIIPGIE